MKILVAEDERELSKPLITILEHKGYSADAAYDGSEAYEKIVNSYYDLIILDIMMPKMSGIEVLQKIRSEDIRTPVIMLTAKSESEDKIAGLDAGADDYLTKPFVMGELLARVRAMTRRSNTYVPDELEFCGAKLFKGSAELSGGNVSFRLSGKEYAIAEIFFNNAGKYIEIARIKETAWGEEAAELPLVDMYINYVKNKLTAINEKITISKNESSYKMEVM